jgi:NTP pyrophosphatase (non-canonical NTP hydrolase)
MNSSRHDDQTTTLESLKDHVAQFCMERDWDQFHGAKDLSIGLITEASELLEIFRFKSDTETEALFADPSKRAKIESELADTLFFLLRFAQMNNIDLATAFANKMDANGKKYPVQMARGNNKKYTELGHGVTVN